MWFHYHQDGLEERLEASSCPCPFLCAWALALLKCNAWYFPPVRFARGDHVPPPKGGTLRVLCVLRSMEDICPALSAAILSVSRDAPFFRT